MRRLTGFGHSRSWVTLARLCSVRALPVRIPLDLRSAGSVADRSALFVGFLATMADSDFSRACIIGYGSSPSHRG
jgi:hypothetical protein